MFVKNKCKKTKMAPFFAVGILFLVTLTLIFCFTNVLNNNQSLAPTSAKVRFVGEYKIGDGEFLPIKEGEHISATKGVVTLRGYFAYYNPETGAYIGKNFSHTSIAMYFNHLGCTVETDGYKWTFDAENPDIGEFACGKMSSSYSFRGSEDSIVTITLNNPHKFGNENAVDEFLQSIEVYSGVDYENKQAREGSFDRALGFAFIITAVVIAGISLFFTMFKVSYKKEVFLIGFMILFAGVYYVFSSHGVYFWSYIVALNEMALHLSVMLFMIFISALIISFLSEKHKFLGIIALCISMLASCISLFIPIISKITFYDTWLIFLIAQSVASIIQIVGLLLGLKQSNKSQIFIKVLGVSFSVCFLLDFVFNIFGFVSGAFTTKIAFVVVFVIALIAVLKIIPQNINAALRAKEIVREQQVLKMELEKSRVSLMLSQIKPHFIYNTLGTIGEFCEDQPKRARQLVQEFSLYLRGNFGELDNMNPVPVMQEMEHVKHYVKIENVRFPDMVITFDLPVKDFFIPALSVQPLVENAIKHGLLKLEHGGVVTVKTYESENAYHISVIDNGAGFDTSIPIDEKKHIGIRNIRDRLKIMCGGTLQIQSEIGVGTTAIISIPKERENESDNS